MLTFQIIPLLTAVDRYLTHRIPFVANYLLAPLSLLVTWGMVWGYLSLLGLAFDNAQVLPLPSLLNSFLVTCGVLPVVVLLTVSGNMFVKQLLAMVPAGSGLRGLVGCGLALVLIMYLVTLTSVAVSVVTDFKQPVGLLSVALPVLVEVMVLGYTFRTRPIPASSSAA